jgi:hypothetical protein
MASNHHPVDPQVLPASIEARLQLAQSVAGTPGALAPERGRVPLARRAARPSKRDIQRAVEAVRAAGLQIASVRIEPDGAILVIPGKPAPVQPKNPFDID